MPRKNKRPSYKLRSGINGDDDSMRLDEEQPTHDNHVSAKSLQNEQAALNGSKTNTPDVNAIFQLLMEQNRMLMEQLNMSKTTINEQPNQFYVMPLHCLYNGENL